MLYVHIIIESGDVTLTRSTKLEIKEEKKKTEISTACGEKDTWL